MKKILLFIFTLFAVELNAQNFQLTYYLSGCAGNPLTGASGIYLYMGAGTQNATSTYDYTAGSFSGTDLPLQNIGNNTWEMCFNPYLILRDASHVLIPASTTIYNFEINFRDSSGTIFTGQCGSGSYVEIDNPMTNPQTLFPNILHGQPVANCSVGIDRAGSNIGSVITFPNPMNQHGSTFTINLNENKNVSLQLFNIFGTKVRTLINNAPLSGMHQISFDGFDDNGNALPDGCYFYSMTSGERIAESGRLIILR